MQHGVTHEGHQIQGATVLHSMHKRLFFKMLAQCAWRRSQSNYMFTDRQKISVLRFNVISLCHPIPLFHDQAQHNDLCT